MVSCVREERRSHCTQRRQTRREEGTSNEALTPKKSRGYVPACLIVPPGSIRKGRPRPHSKEPRSLVGGGANSL